MRWIAFVLGVAACGDNSQQSAVCDWTQWAGGPDHAGASCARGKPLEAILDKIVYDPFTDQELADTEGTLLVHYQVPLVTGDDVYMMTKGGTYTPCDAPPGGGCADLYRLNSQTWIEKGYCWEDSGLVEAWSFTSDWKPVPGLEFEPMFQPALAGDRILIPGVGGSLHEVDRATGQPIRRIEPFPALDGDTYVTSAVTVAPDGTAYYTTLSLQHLRPYEEDAHGALVVVAPDGTTRTVDFSTLIPDAPAADAACEKNFDNAVTPLPFPPPNNPDGSPARPPEVGCGTQRPAVNVTPAIGPDGRIFVVSRAHRADRYAYAVALEPDLSLAWAASLRDRLDDGCGVTIPINAEGETDIGKCSAGAAAGIDPATNGRPAARVDDRSSSSPTALPDGGVLVGTFSLYNQERGHLFRFDKAGTPIANYPYGWDITPAIVPTADDLEVVLKHNVYGVDMMGFDTGPFMMVRLDGALAPIWKLVNTSTDNCVRLPGGGIGCQPDTNPNGFEWCINAPAVDADGTTFANAEDGFLYAIAKDGTVRDRLFLDTSLGAAYTPLSLDAQGRVYAMNDGRLFVIGTR